MTDSGNIGRVLAQLGDEASCAELLLAIAVSSDEELPVRLSAVAAAILDCREGGFYGTTPPAPLPLVEEINVEGERHGCYAFNAPPALRPRLAALASLTAVALAQRKKLGHYQQIIDQIYDSVIVMDMAGFITGWNQGAERMFGYRADEAIGRNVLFLYAEDDDAMQPDSFLEHGGRVMEVRRRRKSGDIFWAQLSLSHMRDARGNVTGMIGYLSDISELVENRHLLKLHAKIFEQSEEAIVITSLDWKILSVNPAFIRITGHAEEDMLGKPLTWLGMRAELAKIDAVRSTLKSSGRWRDEIRIRRHSGESLAILASASVVAPTQGEAANIIWIFSDITDRQRAEERIHHLAYYDAVTGLPNRSLLAKLTEQALAEARRDGSGGALMFIDLDRFKPVNDSLGHDAGNTLLREVGDRFRSAMRSGDIVARIGDDEFVVALFDHEHNEHSGAVAQRLLSTLDAPFVIGGHEIRIGASIGISAYPDDGTNVEVLLHNADIALYRAKQTGGNSYVYFNSEMNQHLLERLKIETGLRRAIENDELLLHYQPKVDLDNGTIIGAEVLVRWQHPERGLLAPDEFIPIAEESGLIVDIGNWVLEKTCLQARLWHEAGQEPIRVAVNLSARQFGPGLANSIRDLLLRHDLPADWLELEITESMLMNNAEHVIGMMDDLSRLGVSLSLDDFGTGYSSLSYLKRFPIETIKIDRSFVKGTPEDSDDCAIAAAIVSMSKQLKLRVIAEGVETDAQMDFMRSLGCDEIQGYLFSPPVVVEKFEAMLRDNKKL